MFSKLILYFYTLRYLKFSQLFWQCIRRIYHPKISLLVNTIQINETVDIWVQSIKSNHQFFDRNKITFLNQSMVFDNTIWQRCKTQSRLWQYNLHYFQGLLSSNPIIVESIVQLLASWLIAFPVYSTRAWEPYPISIRLGNCIKCYLNGRNLSQEILKSVYLQARYLYKIPEYQLLGNHLLENAKALVFAGIFFSGDEPKKWFQLGVKILHREIPEQILEDGGYFELSPMYHSLMLELMLDLYNLFNAYQIDFPKAWLERLQKMRYWLKVMTHPDDEIAFFNDAAIGIASSPSALENYANNLGLPKVAAIENGITHLKDSGYIRLQRAKFVAILDCAKVGPDYQPAHAHADTLSFELSIGKNRCIVNSGTSVYADDLKLRAWQRSTASHSTVEINKENSSQVWSVFRVAKRAYPCNLKIENNGDEWIVSCGHTGYKKAHKRVWKMTDSQFSVSDYCDTKLPAVTRFYLHPDVVINDNGALLVGEEKITLNSPVKIKIVESEYYPEFGKKLRSHVLMANIARYACYVFTT